MFPHRLNDSRAFDIAEAMLEGFNRHYRLFSETNRAAKQRFEQADWHGQQRAQRERIEFYDLRVGEAVERLRHGFDTARLADDTWQQVKLHYIGLLVNHHQPELAETFFQLGIDQDPAPQLLPQRLHVRAAGRQHRVHRERRAGVAADLPRLLPDARRPARDAAAHRWRIGSSNALFPPWNTPRRALGHEPKWLLRAAPAR